MMMMMMMMHATTIMIMITMIKRVIKFVIFFSKMVSGFLVEVEEAIIVSYSCLRFSVTFFVVMEEDETMLVTLSVCRKCWLLLEVRGIWRFVVLGCGCGM